MPEICDASRRALRSRRSHAARAGPQPSQLAHLKGLGKIGMVGVATAIANAVCHQRTARRARRNLLITPGVELAW